MLGMPPESSCHCMRWVACDMEPGRCACGELPSRGVRVSSGSMSTRKQCGWPAGPDMKKVEERVRNSPGNVGSFAEGPPTPTKMTVWKPALWGATAARIGVGRGQLGACCTRHARQNKAQKGEWLYRPPRSFLGAPTRAPRRLSRASSCEQNAKSDVARFQARFPHCS